MTPRTDTKKIILHCSATPEGKDFKAKDIDTWHKKQGWEMIGYHFVIDLDGKFEDGRPERMKGAHCVNHNSDSIGICYIGGCDKNNKPKDTRTPAQKESINKLVYTLLTRYKLTIDDVYTHNYFDKGKACPSFSLDKFKQEYKEWFELYKRYSAMVVCPCCGKRFLPDYQEIV